MNGQKVLCKMMGISVTNGARETFSPALVPCCKLSVMIRVESGPGAKPADTPSTSPIIIY
jgi:hypothetical protein